MSITKSVKSGLKQVLPPPVHAFNREVERILAQQREVQKQLTEQNSALAALVEKQTVLLSKQETMLSQQGTMLSQQGTMLSQQGTMLSKQETTLSQQGALLLDQEQRLHDAVSQLEELRQQNQALSEALQSAADERKKLGAEVEKVRRQAVDASRHASEAVWAQIFHDTIVESTWLKDKTFSPGRWAVGYPYLYVMYRVLNEARPKRILELGLGQSTRMIGQYAAAFDDVEHIVVEHDQEWIDFFCHDFHLSPHTKIVKLEREMVPYKEAEAVRVFKDFQKTFAGQKFDFISIDAPLGGDMKQYARIDVLQMMPDCLSEDFVVMIDDCNRSGETHTATEMELCLSGHHVSYKKGKYMGDKDCILLCAESFSFLSSM